jgi:hypothetical protein
MRHTRCYYAALHAVEPSANEPIFQPMSELEMLEDLYKDEIWEKDDEREDMSYDNIARWIFSYKLKGPFRTPPTVTHWWGEDCRYNHSQRPSFTNWWGDDCYSIDDDFDYPSPRSSRDWDEQFDGIHDGYSELGSFDQDVKLSDLEEMSLRAAEQEAWDFINQLGIYFQNDYWAGAQYEYLDEDLDSPAWHGKMGITKYPTEAQTFLSQQGLRDVCNTTQRTCQINGKNLPNSEATSRTVLHDSHGYRGRTPKYKNPRRNMTHARGAQAPVNGMPIGHYLPVQKRCIEMHYE